ncbi:exopolyphosphatase [Corynebacterium poyangense]|uniref:Exopolyphosphatase n=1 Tax=Corynebacterium poyangense TaxID=2684405 RepID=A0A7H0SQM4_9CORY|nr:FAD/NAD(P)-binding protein [Corynebacterium poyangense]QNQ90849.1 exopolyphosphatase [Corynebacterium poyangense]
MTEQIHSIALIGLGPRGVSLCERLAQLSQETAEHNPPGSPSKQIKLHLIDDAPAGAGRIWDPEQTPTLCMNTLAHAVTLFPEENSGIKGGILPGPTLHEWIRLIIAPDDGVDDIASEKRETFFSFPPDKNKYQRFWSEMENTQPESHPSRALYGAYIRWCLDVALARLDKSVHVIFHQARAQEIQRCGSRDTIHLDNGVKIQADSTVLAPGWLRPGLNIAEQELAQAVKTHPSLVWIRPDNPVEQPLDAVPDSAPVLVRGLGMGFFDVMALLTLDRGGEFIPDAHSRSGLRYLPSSREPHFLISSHRGYPYLPKSEYHSLPPRAAIPRLRKLGRRLRPQYPGHETPTPASIDFRRTIWPAIIRDSYEAYYQTLARVRPEAFKGSDHTSLIHALDHAPDEDLLEQAAELAQEFLAQPEDRFDLREFLDPLPGTFSSPEALGEHIAHRMSCDIHEAVLARDSALKAGLWSISASRKPASIIGAEGAYTLDSRPTLSAFMSLGQMVGSGPPLFRTRQLLALYDAGFVTFLGAEPQLSVVDDDREPRWRIKTRSLPHDHAEATTLIDAWMHQPTIARPHDQDPLLPSLEHQGRLRPFHYHTAAGEHLTTGSPEVDRYTRRLIHPDGNIDPSVHLVGIPTYAQMPDTTISPIPNSRSLMLQETSAAAWSVWQQIHP